MHVHYLSSCSHSCRLSIHPSPGKKSVRNSLRVSLTNCSWTVHSSPLRKSECHGMAS